MGNEVRWAQHFQSYHFHNYRPYLIQPRWLYRTTVRMHSKSVHIRNGTNRLRSDSEQLMFYFVRFDNWDERKEHQNMRCYGTSAHAACPILFTLPCTCRRRTVDWKVYFKLQTNFEFTVQLYWTTANFNYNDLIVNLHPLLFYIYTLALILLRTKKMVSMKLKSFDLEHQTEFIFTRNNQ